MIIKYNNEINFSSEKITETIITMFTNEFIYRELPLYEQLDHFFIIKNEKTVYVFISLNHSHCNSREAFLESNLKKCELVYESFLSLDKNAWVNNLFEKLKSDTFHVVDAPKWGR